MSKLITRFVLPIAAVAAIALVLSVGRPDPVKAAGTESVNGWGWSSTIGWILFNTGASNPVTIDTTTGYWSGYAWSSNIGWISFNAAETSYCGSRATLNTSTGAVTGWARALSAAGRESEGWNGCIELSGTNHASPDVSGNGGVTMNTANGTFGGYAWGGPVVGWVQISAGSTPTTCTGNCSPYGNPSVSCSPSNPVSVTAPATVIFTASASNGSGVYEYSWNGGSTWSPTETTYSQTYGSVGTFSGPALQVRNAGSAASAVAASPACASVTAAGTLSVKIGTTVAGATREAVTIKRGGKFSLKWDRFLPATYNCTPSIAPSSADTSWANWTGADFTASGQTGLLSTSSSVPAGTYTFSLSCVDSAASPGPNYSGSAKLIVSTTDTVEI